MKTIRAVLAVALCLPLEAAIENVRVVGTTPTQAILSYNAPDASACTVEVSEQASYTPLVHDVDSSLFPGGNLDSRSGSLTLGRGRVFVVGERTVAQAASGRRYSRALQTDTVHYYRVTCGSDVATGTFRTANIKFGNTRMDALPADPNNPDYPFWPSTLKYGETAIDPSTGVLLKEAASPGWLFSNSTGSSGWAFSSASSSNWTDPASALADDSTYAVYSGSGQDWLFLGTGGAYPDSSTITTNELSFINVYLKGYCSGADCSSGGQTLQICMTRDGVNCELPIREVDLPATENTVMVSDSSTADKPGDFFSYELVPHEDWKVGDGAIYNTSADYTKVYFTNSTDCNRLQTGEVIKVYRNSASTTSLLTLSSLSCTANPPVASISASTDLDDNGTNGLPFMYPYGIEGNKRFGFLVRKKNSGTDAALRLNYAYYKAASTGVTKLTTGAGGFQQMCSVKPTANGYYHCKTDYGALLGVRTEKDGDLTVKFLGLTKVRTNTAGIRTQVYWCDPEFDVDDPNVMYCAMTSSYDTNRVLVAKVTYTGNDKQCGEEGSSCSAAVPYGTEDQRWPTAPTTYANLTPCLNGCTNPASDDYSIEQQMIRYTAGKDFAYNESDFPNCSIRAVQGTHLVGACASGNQDSYAWMFAMDLGNKEPVGSGFVGSHGNTQQLMGAVPLFNRTHSRWCTLHTYQNPMCDYFAVPEMQMEKSYPFHVTLQTALSACSKSGTGTCDACPSVTVDGFDYSGKNWCATVDVTSTWDSSWGDAPSNYVTGDPVSTLTKPFHWLRAAEAGDLFVNGGEYLKILQKVSNTQWVVERGFGFDQSYLYPRAHSSGVALNATCATATDTINYPGPEVMHGTDWYFTIDPDGTGIGTTYTRTAYVGHAFSRPNVRAAPKYPVSLADFTDPTAMALGNSVHATVNSAVKFSGKHSDTEGTGTESHASYSQYNAPDYEQKWFLDVNPWLYTPNSATTESTNVTGNLWKYAFSPTWYDGFNYKYLDLFGMVGYSRLRDVSGPATVLSGTSADAYKLCYAYHAGECYSGSTAGEIYFNAPAVDGTLKKCKQAEFIPEGIRDVCVAEHNAISSALVQWGLPRSDSETLSDLARGRVISRTFNNYRMSVTENVKAVPDGKWILSRTQRAIKLPPYPVEDTMTRSTFVPVSVKLNPPSGVESALVEFGYGPDFHCTARDEACVKDASTTEPYMFAGDTLTGIPCSAGCTVEIPAISGKVLYYRWKYLQADNEVIAQGSTQITAVP